MKCYQTKSWLKQLDVLRGLSKQCVCVCVLNMMSASLDRCFSTACVHTTASPISLIEIAFDNDQ